MDAIDQKIVNILRQNSRLSQEHIAREVSLSRPAIHERLKRLEENRVIRGYTALVDWNAIGLSLTAFIWVGIDLTPCTNVFEGIKAINNDNARIEECHRVTGEWCLLLKVRTASTLDLQDFLDQLRIVPGLKGTMTTVVLSTFSESS